MTRRRIVDMLGAGLCTGALVFAWVTAVAASAELPAEEVREGAPEHVLTVEGSGSTPSPGLRNLPLLKPNGPVANSFPLGKGLDDPAKVADVARSLAASLGLSGVIDELLVAEVVVDRLVMYRGYPYPYAEFDPRVDTYLDEEAVREHPDRVVELASLLVLSAGQARSSPQNSHAGLAYSLLRRAREIANTCDIQLDLTFTVAMGFAPRLSDLEPEVQASRRLCPGDPTPLWLLGQVEIVQASHHDRFFEYEVGPNAMEDRAEETFAALRREFPSSPLGWAGAADLRLKQADEGDELGIQRFENRVRRREALEHYVQARDRSADPALLAGYGMALSGLGRHEEALRALTQLHELFPDEPGYEALLVGALQRAGRPGQVVEVLAPRVSTNTSARMSLRMTPQTFGVWEPQLFTYGSAGSRAGSVFDLSHLENAGASTTDLGFLPEANGDWSAVWCPQVNLIAAQIQTGDAARAWDTYRRGERISPATCADGDGLVNPLLHRMAVAAAMASDDPRLQQEAVAELVDEYVDHSEARSLLWDHLHNYWRSAGEWQKARRVQRQWSSELPTDPWAAHRQGEIEFLSKNFEEAVDSYSHARSLFLAAPNGGWGDHGYRELIIWEEEGTYLNDLELGTALEYAGREDEAAHAYRRAAQGARQIGTGNIEFVEFYATSQLGGLALAAGNYEEASAHYQAILAGAYNRPPVPGDDVIGTSVLHGAQENNLALALAKLGSTREAMLYAQAALSYDRANPVFVDTVAFIHQLSGDEQAAVSSYENVLAVDNSAYVSATNFAVLMAQRGHRSQAIELLTMALRGNPTYALGWHNLGVLQQPLSAKLLESQGARAKAAGLDRELRGEEGLLIDDEIHESGLDVSRPLNPDWNYAATATRPTKALTISALLLLVLRLVWRLGLDKLFDAAGERIMTVPRWRWPIGLTSRFWSRLGGAVAVAASAAAIGWPTLTTAQSWLEGAVLGTAVVAMVSLPIFLRRLAAGVKAVRHYAWLPAVAVGAVGAPLGFVFAPYPVLDINSASKGGMDPFLHVQLRWLVPTTVLAAGLPFILLAALDPVPMTRTLALAAIALLASVLTPVPPLDGAYLKHRHFDLGATSLLMLTTIAFTLKWI